MVELEQLPLEGALLLLQERHRTKELTLFGVDGRERSVSTSELAP